MNISERLIEARKAVGLTQLEVSNRTGIDDSSISAFETGKSEPKLGLLSKLAEVYHLPLSYFFQKDDPKAQRILWRNQPDNEQEIRAEFLQLCQQFRQLEVWTNDVIQTDLPFYNERPGNYGYPQVQILANKSRKAMGLGERPGESIYSVLEEVYGIKIFHLDLGDSGSAASAVSEEFGYAILLNSRCSRWRRNHDLAHELFHLLTWNYFGHQEGVREPDTQEEKYATCFAGNLLLPMEAVRTAIEKSLDSEGKVEFSCLDKIAREFDVSLESLLWRMHFIYNVNEERTLEYIEYAKEYVRTAPRDSGPKPPLLPERYRALAIRALQEGSISLARFAKYMRINRIEAEKYLSSGEPKYAEVPTPIA
jgi:Zn-dependent peptidase ImmA (M78 family)/transcriptional regulator with XRE-family HTH domain